MSKETLQKETGSETHGRVLQLVIEGRSYNWHKQYITGAEVKKLAGLPKDSDLYLSIPDPWDDEPIRDESRVDLARPEIEYFFIRRKLKFTINDKSFEWDRQYITGEQIRRLGKIAEEDKIFLQIKEPYKDDLIEDHTKVDLARPGTEHFYSKDTPVEVIIIVNGSSKKWEKKQISFVELIILAYGTYVDKPTMVYTVAYEDGPKQNSEGSMVKGQVVFVKNKMIFHATATDKS